MEKEIDNLRGKSVVRIGRLVKSELIRKLFQNFFTYTGFGFVNQALPFFLLPILTKFLTPKDYGIWATFIAIAGILNIFVCMGSTNAVIREYIDRHKSNFNFSIYVSNALFVVCCMFFIIFLVIFFLRNYFFYNFSIPPNWLFLLPFGSFCFAVYSIPSKIFVYKRKALLFSVLKISATLLEILLSIFFIAVIGLKWQGRILGFIINKALFFVIGVYLILKWRMLVFSISFEYIKHILRYGGPLVFHSLGFAIILATDRFFLNKFVGLHATGLYSVGYTVAAIIGFLVGAFNLAWVPFFYEKLHNITPFVKRRVVKFSYIYFVLLAGIVVLLILIAPYFLKFFVAKNFYGAHIFIIWIAWGYMVHGMSTIMSSYINYAKKTYLLGIIAVAGVICNIILNYGLIKANGAIGAAQATFATFCIRFLLTWYFSNKVYPMPWFSFLKGG